MVWGWGMWDVQPSDVATQPPQQNEKGDNLQSANAMYATASRADVEDFHWSWSERTLQGPIILARSHQRCDCSVHFHLSMTP